MEYDLDDGVKCTLKNYELVMNATDHETPDMVESGQDNDQVVPEPHTCPQRIMAVSRV